MDQPGLVKFAGEFSAAARALNFDATRVQAIYESMVAKIRTDAQSPAGWVAAKPLAVPGQVSGQTAPLDASGLAGLASAGNPIEMEQFLTRVVESLGFSVADKRGLSLFASTCMSLVKQQNCDAQQATKTFTDIVASIRQESQRPGSWVGSRLPTVPAVPASGQVAPLDAGGFAGTVAANNPQEVENFIKRVVESLGLQATNQQSLTHFSTAWAAMVRQENCQGSKLPLIYQDMVSRICSDAQVNGGWLAPALPAARPAPMSGQTASLDATGFTGTVMSGNVLETQSFVRRLVEFLGGRVLDNGQGLSQFAQAWDNSVRQVSCDVVKVKPIYDQWLLRSGLMDKSPGPGSQCLLKLLQHKDKLLHWMPVD
jgi:hypothetical protein